MKKKSFISISMFLVLIIIALTLPVMATRIPELEGSILKYEPYPAAQGEIVKVWVKVVNEGTSAGDVEIKFIPEYPFSLTPGEESVKKIGTIPGTKEAVEEFNILVDLYAPNGERELKFQYRWTGEDIWMEIKEPITIESTDSLVVIEKFETVPSKIKPGDEVELKITIKNEGISSIKTTDVTLDTTQTDFFSPLESGNTKRIGFLEPHESKEFSFKIMTDSNADIKVYNIPVEIKFKDDKNQEYASISKIGIKMNAEPDIIMLIDSSDIYDSSTAGNVRAKIVNKGIVDVKYITLKIIKTPEYEVLSPSNIKYIGNLDNDDFDSAEFLIQPLVDKPTMKYLLEYKDPYNNEYSQEFSLPLRIVSKADLGQKSGGIGIYILLAIIVVAVIWIYRRKKRKAKK